MPDLRKTTGTRDATGGQFNKPGVKYPTPDTAHDFIIVERASRDSKEQPIAYGDAHPTIAAAKLIDQSFVNDEDNAKTRIRVYSAHGTPAQQDVWNAAISYSGESNAHQILVRAYTLPRQGYSPATKGTADTVVGDAKLVKEDTQPIEGDNWHHRVIRIFEVLPGPWLPFTRYDDDLGPIQGRRRAVLNTGQAASLTGTSKTSYEARDGSSIVSWELQENWSDGTGSEGNPAYPIASTDFYDNQRGAVEQTSQIVVKTGNEVGSLTLVGGVVTQTRYEPYNEFLLRKIVETWSVPGPTLRQTTVDDDGNTVVVAKTLKDITAITEGDSIGGGSLVITTSEAFLEPVAWEVTRTRVLPGAWIAAAPKYDDALGPIAVRRRLVAKAGQAATLTATKQTTYEAWDGSNLVAWEIEESWSNGTGGVGNPAYPIQTSKIYDDTRGPVARTVQLKAKAGSEEGSVAHAAGTITETSYTAYNEYLLRRQVDVWVLSSAPVVSDKPYDTQRGAIAQTTTLVAKTGSEEASLAESGGTVTETSFKPLNDVVLRRIEEVWAVPGPTLLDTEVNDDGSTTVVAKTLKAISSITEGEVYSAPSLIITTSEAYKEPIAWEVTRTRTLPGPLVHSIEYLNNDKELPRVTTRQVVATEASYTPGEQGVATCPVAGFGALLLAEQELQDTERASIKEIVRIYEPFPGYILTAIETDPDTNVQYTITRSIVAEETPLPANGGGKVYEKQPIDDVKCIHVERDLSPLIGMEFTDAPEISYTFPGLLIHRGRTLTERSQPASYRPARSLRVRARRVLFYTTEEQKPEIFQWIGVNIRSDAGGFSDVLHDLTSVEIGGRRQRVEQSFPTASEYPAGEEVLISAPSERAQNGLFRNEHQFITLL